MLISKVLVSVLFATALPLGCALTSDKVPGNVPGSAGGAPLVVQGETVADRAAHEADSEYFVDVEFAKGSSVLNEQSSSTISSLLKRARAEGEILDAKVLAWADQEYPSANRKKLSKGARKLAGARIKSIDTHIKTTKMSIKVDGHNMAERPSAISRWFNTPDARFKRSLLAAGLPTTAEDAPVTGRASHAVILVTLKP